MKWLKLMAMLIVTFMLLPQIYGANFIVKKTDNTVLAFTYGAGSPKLALWKDSGTIYLVEFESVGEAWIPKNGSFNTGYILPEANLSSYITEKLIGDGFGVFVSEMLNLTHSALKIVSSENPDIDMLREKIVRMRDLAEELSSKTALINVLKILRRISNLINNATSVLAKPSLNKKSITEILVNIASETAKIGYISSHLEEIKSALKDELGEINLPKPSLSLDMFNWTLQNASSIGGMGSETIIEGYTPREGIIKRIKLIFRSYNSTVLEDHGITKIVCYKGASVGILIEGLDWIYSRILDIMGKYGFADIYNPVIILNINLYALKPGENVKPDELLLREKEEIITDFRGVDPETGAINIHFLSRFKGDLTVSFLGKTINLINKVISYKDTIIHILGGYREISLIAFSKNYESSMTSYWITFSSESIGKPDYIFWIDPETGVVKKMEQLTEEKETVDYNLTYSLMAVSIIALIFIVIYEKSRPI